MIYRDLSLTVKADDRGAFEGVATLYGVPDRVGDVLQRGAFDPIPARVPLLWHHQLPEVLGFVDLTDGPDVLAVRGQMLLDTTDGHDGYSRLTAGVATGLSIGFRLLDSRPYGNGQRLITKAELVECSLTAFPVMAAARVTAVKAETADVMRRLHLARMKLSATGSFCAN